MSLHKSCTTWVLFFTLELPNHKHSCTCAQRVTILTSPNVHSTFPCLVVDLPLVKVLLSPLVAQFLVLDQISVAQLDLQLHSLVVSVLDLLHIEYRWKVALPHWADKKPFKLFLVPWQELWKILIQ